MEIIQRKLILSRVEYYKMHLLIINNFIPIQMTPKELEVLAAFMSLTGDLANEPFSTSGRKIVRERMKLSPGGLGNYLDAFTKKKFINEEDGILKIWNILYPKESSQGYQFKIEMKDE